MKINKYFTNILLFSILMHILSFHGCVLAPQTAKFDTVNFLTSWENKIGNSSQIAAKHYLQVTDEHFDRAAGFMPNGEAAPKAAHNAAQQTHAGARTE